MEIGTDNLSIRVASFSCYLDTAKDNLVQRISGQEAPVLLTSENAINTTKPPFDTTNFVFKVPGGPIQDPASGFSFSRETPKDHSEISVFSADKYFNMKLQNENQKYRNPGLTSTRTCTPSLCSEASSVNSQTALLPGTGLQIKQRKAIGRRIFSGFGCQTPCFDRKAVNVAPVSRPGGSQRINHRALEGSTINKELNANHRFGKPGNGFEEPRGSIEVFGSSTIPKGDDVAKNMERKLSVLSWDAIPKGQNLPTSTVGSTTILDDMASDASSDLFEIEHISGSLLPLPRAQAQAQADAEATDDMSSCMSPQSHYAPSEASIHWSVVTASCVPDNCSVLSEYNDEMSASVAGEVIARSTKTRVRAQKSPRVGILGCKSYKAVDVAEHVPFGKSQGNRVRVQDIGTPDLPRALW